MKGAKGLAWGLAIVACAAIPAILLLNAGAGEYEQGWVGNVAGCVAGLTTVSVGLLLALRRPANPIGWILLGSGLMFASSGLATSYGGYALEHPGTLPGGRAAVIWDSATWPLLFAGVVAIAFVFPDGRLPSPRWRPFAVVGVTSVALMVLGSLLGSEKLEKPFEAVAPLGILPDAVSGSMQGLGLLGFLVTLVAAVVAQVSRYRRSEGELRAQMKWLAYASVLIPLAIAACFADPTSTDVVTFIALVTVLTAFPAAIGIAVLRYRLYEIDRLINATLVYGALTVVLAAAFVGVTVAGGVLIGGGSAIPTAAATLAVALAFRHVRAWLQTRVDRRFNRARYEGLQRVDRFLADLRLAEPSRRALAACLLRPLRTRAWVSSSGCRATGSTPMRPGGWCPSCRRLRWPHPSAAGRASARHRGPRSGPARATQPARPSDPAGWPRDRDRQAAGRGAPSARRGRGVAYADCHRDLRGASPARARPPRRGAAATGLARARPAPRPARPRRGGRGRGENDAGLCGCGAGRGNRGAT